MASVILAGTTSTTALNLTGDTSGELQLKTNNGSTTAMTLTTAGNVGVGTTSPTSILDIATSNSGLVITNTGASNKRWRVGGGTGGIFQITEAGVADRLTINTSGNVGIDTASPAAKLHVNGENIIVDRNAGDPYYTFYTGGVASNVSIYGGSSNGFRVFTNSAERMRITSGGNVGIGNSSPNNTLSIQAGTASVRLDSSTGTNAVYSQFVNTGGSFYVGRDNSTGAVFGAAYASVLFSEGAYPMNFYTAGTERMRISSGGQVGIGGTSLNGILEVFQGTTGSNFRHGNGTYLNISTGAANGNVDLKADATNGNYPAFTFYTGGSERMRILSSGEVCVGRTTSLSSGTLTVATSAVVTSGSDFVKVLSDGIYRQYSSSAGSGFHFTGNAIYPANYNGSIVDNLIAFGAASYRYTTIYASNGTINTSDGNEKQDIDTLSDAELRVAKKVSKLIKKFRFKDAVVKKGDGARIHVGVIAQDVEAAFASEGLDAHQYGMFCEDSWYTVDGKAAPKPENPYTAETPNAVLFTRKGVRYDELLAFIIAAQFN